MLSRIVSGQFQLLDTISTRPHQDCPSLVGRRASQMLRGTQPEVETSFAAEIASSPNTNLKIYRTLVDEDFVLAAFHLREGVAL